MSTIKVLENHVISLVAAGEAVDRPCSAVKELVENSIDAKAKKIIVSLVEGGMKSINVIDNGCGIKRNNIKVAFLNHATSKISSKCDLENIATLGFRGEALAAISAVSKIDIKTYNQTDSIGTHYRIYEGNVNNSKNFLKDFAGPVGTNIEVRDLFYNVPVRIKFLKKNVIEGNLVSNIINKLALSHPEIMMIFIKNHKEVLRSVGDNNIDSVILQILGRDFLNNSLNINYNFNNIIVKGRVTLPIGAKSNKLDQHFFINGRCVKIPIASQALTESFKNEIPIGRYPACVLHITVAFNSVDVNVHPTKNEVRFANEKPIFEAIYYGIKSALMNNNKKFVNFNFEKEINNFKNSNELNQISLKNNIDPLRISELTIDETMKLNKSPLEQMQKLSESIGFSATKIPKLNEFPIKKKVEIRKSKSLEDNNLIFNNIVQVKQNYKIIGEIFSHYLLVQKNESLILIDKHAAHERIIYEYIKSRNQNLNTQRLISVVTISVSQTEYNTLNANMKILKDLGYEIEEFGFNKILIREIPMYLEICDIKSSIQEICSYIINNKNNLDTVKINMLYASIACKSAIKSGKLSTITQMNSLVSTLEASPEIMRCPHGRPIFVVLYKKDIDKYFLR
ncbi:MAG: DNA mismatch repair endonuclease MutL [Candidatus Improbicoccus devescovinae]|nr:MAG: DNA mismatch repair endonuclease MutL [Candidatus Improbicoccus devescovinae]